MMRHVIFALLVIVTAQPALAATVRVPQDHKKIRAAIDASNPGDTILVAPGRYRESIRLKSGIILRSEGDDVTEESTVTITDNDFDGYRAAVNATKATVVVTGNSITQFHGAAIIVKDSQKLAHVFGNMATTADPKAQVVMQLPKNQGTHVHCSPEFSPREV